MAIRLSGMTSGLDTDSIVKAMVSSYTTRKEKYQKAQTKLEWTQDAWKSLNTKVYSLYSNISNLRFSTAYNLKKTSVSDTTKATVKAGSGAPSGTQSLKIKQMAKAGYMTGAEIKADSEKTTLAQLGYTGGDAKLEVKMGDETKSITLSASSTMNDVVKELRNAGLDANYDSSYKRFYISSKRQAWQTILP
ncbi:MAG: flagellar cap protein FliD N-terminal domain-containing protein [Agathobacter rectalis]